MQAAMVAICIVTFLSKHLADAYAVTCIHVHPLQEPVKLAYASAGMQAAVVAMGATAWEVRNAASLLFTALVLRMLGFRNMLKVHSSLLGIWSLLDHLCQLPLLTMYLFPDLRGFQFAAVCPCYFPNIIECILKSSCCTLPRCVFV